MQQTKTVTRYIDYLNELYTYEQILDQFPYLLKSKYAKKLAREGKYGNLLRNHDPIAFSVGMREWKER